MLKEEKLGLFTENDLKQIQLNVKEETDNTVTGVTAYKIAGVTLMATGGATAAGGVLAAGI